MDDIVILKDQHTSIELDINSVGVIWNLSNNLRKLANVIHSNNGNRILLVEPFENTIIMTQFDYNNNNWNIIINMNSYCTFTIVYNLSSF